MSGWSPATANAYRNASHKWWKEPFSGLQQEATVRQKAGKGWPHAGCWEAHLDLPLPWSSYLVQTPPAVWGKEGRLARSANSLFSTPAHARGATSGTQMAWSFASLTWHRKAAWLWIYTTSFSAWDEPLLTHCRVRARKDTGTLLSATRDTNKSRWFFLQKLDSPNVFLLTH